MYCNPTNRFGRFGDGDRRNRNSDFTPAATVSTQREKIPYICGLRARIECEPLSEHSTHSDRVTNIGYLLSLGASPLPAAIRSYLSPMMLPHLLTIFHHPASHLFQPFPLISSRYHRFLKMLLYRM